MKYIILWHLPARSLFPFLFLILFFACSVSGDSYPCSVVNNRHQGYKRKPLEESGCKTDTEHAAIFCFKST